MEDFDACRFDFRFDRKNGLTPSKRKKIDKSSSPPSVDGTSSSAPYKCKICSMLFTNRQGYIRHKLFHRGGGGGVKHVRGGADTGDDNGYYGSDNVGGGGESDKHVCAICRVEFSTNSLLRDRVTDCHCRLAGDAADDAAGHVSATLQKIRQPTIPSNVFANGVNGDGSVVNGPVQDYIRIHLPLLSGRDLSHLTTATVAAVKAVVHPVVSSNRSLAKLPTPLPSHFQQPNTRESVSSISLNTTNTASDSKKLSLASNYAVSASAIAAYLTLLQRNVLANQSPRLNETTTFGGINSANSAVVLKPAQLSVRDERHSDDMPMSVGYRNRALEQSSDDDDFLPAKINSAGKVLDYSLKSVEPCRNGNKRDSLNNTQSNNRLLAVDLSCRTNYVTSGVPTISISSESDTSLQTSTNLTTKSGGTILQKELYERIQAKCKGLKRSAASFSGVEKVGDLSKPCKTEDSGCSGPPISRMGLCNRSVGFSTELDLRSIAKQPPAVIGSAKKTKTGLNNMVDKLWKSKMNCINDAITTNDMAKDDKDIPVISTSQIIRKFSTTSDVSQPAANEEATTFEKDDSGEHAAEEYHKNDAALNGLTHNDTTDEAGKPVEVNQPLTGEICRLKFHSCPVCSRLFENSKEMWLHTTMHQEYIKFTASDLRYRKDAKVAESSSEDLIRSGVPDCLPAISSSDASNHESAIDQKSAAGVVDYSERFVGSIYPIMKCTLNHRGNEFGTETDSFRNDLSKPVTSTEGLSICSNSAEIIVVSQIKPELYPSINVNRAMLSHKNSQELSSDFNSSDNITTLFEHSVAADTRLANAQQLSIKNHAIELSDFNNVSTGSSGARESVSHESTPPSSSAATLLCFTAKSYCDTCGYDADTREELQSHLMSTHGKEIDDLKDYKDCLCLVCGRGYSSLAGLKHHIQQHSEESTAAFACPCGSCASRHHSKGALKNHIRGVHLQPRTGTATGFTCLQHGCVRHFESKAALLNHLTAHSEERPLVCDYPGCEKAFRELKHLKVHQMQHTDLKPLRCELCEYSCRQRNSMNWHMKSKHDLDKQVTHDGRTIYT